MIDPTPAVSIGSESFLESFFTPGNEGPNYFVIKIDGIDNPVPVRRETSLQDVIDTI